GEERATAQLGRARVAARRRVAGLVDELFVEPRVAERARQLTVGGHPERVGRQRAIFRLVRSELGPRRVGGKGRHQGAAERRGGLYDPLVDMGLDQDVDGPAAREPDVPGLLVADAVADDPGMAIASRALDLLAAAPSTHPPLTEPAILPSSAHSRTAPSGR